MSGLAETLEENLRLRALLKANTEALAAKETQLAAKETQLVAKEAERIEAVEQAAFLRRLLDDIYRKKKANERFEESVQQNLFDANIPDLCKPVADDLLAEKPEQQPKKGKKSKPVRRRLANLDLPTLKVHLKVDPDARCLQCDGELTPMGQAESYRFAWVSGYVQRLEIHRDKVVCQGCPEQKILGADIPFALHRASCDDQLLAKVIIDKHEDHIPVNRQSKRFARQGVTMPVSTLSGWLKQAARLATPLAEAIQLDVLSGSWIQGDDSGMPVQDGKVKGQLSKGRIWAFTDQRQCFYGFSMTKEGHVPTTLLKGFSGDMLLADGGSEFNEVCRKLKLDRAGCWAHMRRRFHDALDEHPAAKVALTAIRDLFMLEREWGDIDDPIKRLRLRDKHSKPRVEALMDWLDLHSTTIRPKSLFGGAVKYARNQRDRLLAFLRNGSIPMHNNLSELMLRQPITGRKNWLFAGSEGGAIGAAVLMTILASCRMQELDPQLYLADVLPRLTYCRKDRLAELMPRNWRELHGGVLSPDVV